MCYVPQARVSHKGTPAEFYFQVCVGVRCWESVEGEGAALLCTSQGQPQRHTC